MNRSSQVMIPVTVTTGCKTCGDTIVASSLGDLKKHVCEVSEVTFGVFNVVIIVIVILPKFAI